MIFIEIKWAKSKKNLSHYKKKQLLFLKNIASLVKPSGILVYTVCSLEPEENEEVVEEFLSSHSEFDIKNLSELLSYGHTSVVSKGRYLKTLPHKNNMDGFFSVCFQKKPF